MLDRMTNRVYRNASGSIVASFSYGYDVLGLVTQKISVLNGMASINLYAYDAIGRLISADSKTCTYDLAGNRLSRGADSFSYTHNRMNGILHDTAGNVTNYLRNGISYVLTWNTQGQLLSVCTNSVLAESYTYDPLGRRLSTTTLSTDQQSLITVFHIYDGDHCVADTDASGNPMRLYTWGVGVDNLLALTAIDGATTNTYYAIKDHLNTVHALVDASGAIAASYTYDAWGNVQCSVTGAQCRFLFQGREYSYATGLYNFRARWYNPEWGRWLSKDPIGLEGGLNLYVFCGNDPVKIGRASCRERV